jgi:hypothetical protein
VKRTTCSRLSPKLIMSGDMLQIPPNAQEKFKGYIVLDCIGYVVLDCIGYTVLDCMTFCRF